MNDTDTVVFVGVPDLVAITGRTRARFSQLVSEIGTPNAVLPAGTVLINGKPVWSLAIITPRLEAHGFPISRQEVRKLVQQRSVSAKTIPVGVSEGAEVLGIPDRTFRGRCESGSAAPVRFTLSRDRVWDLNALVEDAVARGFAVDEAAAQKWRIRNGGGTPAVTFTGMATVRVEFAATATDSDAVAVKLSEFARALSNLRETGDVTVIEAAIESVSASPTA